MLLLLDIGNTNTHAGLARASAIIKQANIPTPSWNSGQTQRRLKAFASGGRIDGVAMCSVVPAVTPLITRFAEETWNITPFILTHATVTEIGIDYPSPQSIGPDRLANAIAAKHYYGAPSVVVDFGTAVTFDVIDFAGNYVGGIIAPGLAAMTEYLHEKTALLPRIHVREIDTVIGKNTEEAMLIGAVHGYRGLIRELIAELKAELGAKNLRVLATGGYAELLAAKLPEITAIEPLLTLNGLRLAWLKTKKLPRLASKPRRRQPQSA